MKKNELVSTLSVVCLLVSLPALAQQNLVMPPPAIQAIDTHLQQSRTQKQREAMEQKRAAAPVPHQQTARKKSDSSKTGAVKAKSNPALHEQSLDNKSTSTTNN